MFVKNKVIKVVVIVLVAVLLLEGISIAVSSVFASRDKEWGLKLSVSGVSSKGLTLTMERNDSEKEENLTVGDDFGIQRKTLLGWKDLKTSDGNGIVFHSIGYPMNDGDSKTWNLQLNRVFGRLWPGVYRIYKDASTDDCYSHSEEEIKEQNLNPSLYVTFIVLF